MTNQRSKKPAMAKCAACRRLVRPEHLDGSNLCSRCRQGAAALWVGVMSAAQVEGAEVTRGPGKP